MCPKYIFSAKQDSEGAIFVPFSIIFLFVGLLIFVLIPNFLKNSNQRSLS